MTKFEKGMIDYINRHLVFISFIVVYCYYYILNFILNLSEFSFESISLQLFLA